MTNWWERVPFYFFFQAEDGIRDLTVTGVQTCALPISILNLAGEVVECNDGRYRDEDAQSRRDQGLSDTARNYTHAAGSRGRDAPESVDDSDHGTEQSDERGRGADRSQEPETPLQLDQRL